MKVPKDVMLFLGYQLVNSLEQYKTNILGGDDEYVIFEDLDFPCWMKKVQSVEQSYYNESIAIVDCISIEAVK